MDSKFYLVRHTRTSVKEGVCYGQSDVELSEYFESEYVVIQQKLENISFEAVYSSPLKRCRHLAALLHTTISIDNRLMEMNFGDWEGKAWDYIFSVPEGKVWFADYINNRSPNGESFCDLINRVGSFISDVKNIKGNILLVTHAGVIRAIAVCLGIMEANAAFDMPVPFGHILKIDKNELIAL